MNEYTLAREFLLLKTLHQKVRKPWDMSTVSERWSLDTNTLTRISSIVPTEQLQYALCSHSMRLTINPSFFFEMTQRVVDILDSASEENAQVFHLIRINNRKAQQDKIKTESIFISLETGR